MLWSQRLPVVAPVSTELPVGAVPFPGNRWSPRRRGEGELSPKSLSKRLSRHQPDVLFLKVNPSAGWITNSAFPCTAAPWSSWKEQRAEPGPAADLPRRRLGQRKELVVSVLGCGRNKACGWTPGAPQGVGPGAKPTGGLRGSGLHCSPGRCPFGAWLLHRGCGWGVLAGPWV